MPFAVTLRIFGVTLLTVGWMCRMIWPLVGELRRHVERDAREERREIEIAAVCEPTVPTTVLRSLPVTKYSSSPALMTAF